MGKTYTEQKFKTQKEAEKSAQKLKKQIGYLPEVFKITTQKGKVHYSVVKPKGLKRLT